jgi:iron-sulfur cluster repair protein YtfE (RIC family)
MKRHPALYTLSHDHHQGLILAQQLKKGAPQYKGMPSTLEAKKEYTLAFYKSELIKHFKEEEEILFTAVIKKDDKVDNLITEIISEHRKMESLVNNLEQTLHLEGVLDELGKLLERHIRKEERKLFPMIQELFSEEELANIGESLSNSRQRKKNKKF